MTFEQLLTELSQRGIEFKKMNDGLLLRGGENAVDSQLKDLIRVHKGSLLTLLGKEADEWWPTPVAILPSMLPLVSLNAEQIAGIVAQVPGGASNVQDIYPLAPLQEGIFFHHLMTERGDPYLLSGLLAFDSRSRLDGYLEAQRAVMKRHDILRTAIFWEGLPEPVQVVLRRAELPVEEVELSGEGDAAEELYRRFDPRHRRMDLRQAPLLRLYIAHDAAQNRWLMMMLIHHVTTDHVSLDLLFEEVGAQLHGRGTSLADLVPFRNYIAQTRVGISREEQERFFGGMLGDVEEPTAPFGLMEVQGDGKDIVEASLDLPTSLGDRMREIARRFGVSVASLCHLAWAQVLSRVSGREDVVFGTVLFGRMQGNEGIDRALGLYINTLPIRIRIGNQAAGEGLRRTHLLLAELLRYECASLALAQRASGVPAPAPLFSSLLNYRHSRLETSSSQQTLEGVTWLRAEERTNYPIYLSIDDFGEGFRLTAQTLDFVGAERICEFMQTALDSLVTTLETVPETPLQKLGVFPEHTVPMAYTHMKKMPLTSNGKLDRRALPEPKPIVDKSSVYEAPVGDTETLLAQAFADVLELEHVGRHDNFFELGGHSLLIVKLLSRLTNCKLGLSPEYLFRRPTVSSLAEILLDSKNDQRTFR
jgi:hypothetical protein